MAKKKRPAAPTHARTNGYSAWTRGVVVGLLVLLTGAVAVGSLGSAI